MGVAQMIDELYFRLEQRPGQSRAVVAAEHAVFATVVHAEVHFQGRFGREHFFAQHAPVKVLSVSFHQVFLYVFGRGERRGALLTRVLGSGHEKVTDDVLLIVFEVRERQMAVRTRQLDLVVVGVNVVVVIVVDADLRGRSSRGRLRLLMFSVISVVSFLFYVTLVGRRRIATRRRTGLFAGRVIPLVVGRLVLARRGVMVFAAAAAAATVLGRRQRQVCGTRLDGFFGQQTAARRRVSLVVVVVTVRAGYYRPVVQGHGATCAFAAVGVVVVAVAVVIVVVLYVVVEDGTQIVGGRKVFL